MTLLIAVFAAVISTIVWYKNAPNNTMKEGVLCLMFWAASLMWFVDAIFEYAHMGASYFTPTPAQMLNDLYLGLSAVALGMVIWTVIVLMADKKGVLRAVLTKR